MTICAWYWYKNDKVVFVNTENSWGHIRRSSLKREDLKFKSICDNVGGDKNDNDGENDVNATVYREQKNEIPVFINVFVHRSL